MTKRILICRANQLDPDPRVEKIARSLLRHGYSVTLLGWDMDGEYPPEEEKEGFNIIRLAVRARFGRGMVNITHQIRWQAALLGWLLRYRHTFDLVHACDFDTVLAALACKTICGVQVIYDIFDFYADMLRATPAAVKRLIRFVDLKAIGMADALILADDSRYQQILGANPRCSIVLYNCLDIQFSLSPQVHNRDNSLQIAYIGNLQIERGLLELLGILQKHPEWTLDLAGFGSDEGQIVAVARQLPNVTWHGRVPYTRALQLSQAADALIATYNPAIPNNRYASPNKVFEAMMLGKPIIVARGTNMDRIIEEADCGLVVDYGSPAALETALLALAEDPSNRQQLGDNARRAFETTYNWTRMETRLLNLYQQLLQPDPPETVRGGS